MRVSILSMLDHLAWADARVLHLLQAQADSAATPQALRLLAHLVAAERVWLMRMRGEDSRMHPIWPEWTLAQVAEIAAETHRAYRESIDGLSDAEGERVVEYRNSQGVAFRTPVAEILTHVMLHGSYHRGQIALLLRGASVAPANTDFITFVRERM